jgi:hypothetical protein
MHWLSAVHVVGHVAAPSHRYGVQLGAPALPFGANVQVPSEVARLQTSQAPPHAVLQHTPSDAKPLAHDAPLAAAWPFFRRHEPVALHVLAPEHVSASSAFVTAVHAPDVLHVWQTPLHAAEQQFSSQIPLAHWAAAVQACPALNVQTPVALQVFVPVHVLGSSAFVTLLHAPVGSHVWQLPLHAAEQHLSSQMPLAHCVVVVHV